MARLRVPPTPAFPRRARPLQRNDSLARPTSLVHLSPNKSRNLHLVHLRIQRYLRRSPLWRTLARLHIAGRLSRRPPRAGTAERQHTRGGALRPARQRVGLLYLTITAPRGFR